MELDFPIVDAHQHFWDPVRNYHPWLRDEPMIPFRYGSYAALRVPFLPADYLRESAGWPLRRSVYIEAEWDPTDALGETRWVHELARDTGWPHAMVAQAWLDREDVAELLAAQASFALVRGVRHKPRAAPNAAEARRGEPGSMDDARWRDGYARLAGLGLSFDLQTPWWHLDAAAELARDFPRTTMVLNHTGLPADRSAEGLRGWREALALLAREPNTALKISGLGQAGRPWRAEDNVDLVREAIAIFGPGRCMFASNFPVDRLVGRFDTIWRGFAQAVAGFEPAVQRALFHDNACRIYRLD